MKKLSLLLFAAGLVSLSACKKEYTCKCEVFGITVEETAEFKKKADAEAWCEEGSGGLCSLQ